ncbi:MAG: hypothetical protein IJN90_06620 [Bacilli bacterium]|nr:hypothetical protein [Bacilli bacterium]
MEEMENEYDKGIYWLIFFVLILLLGLFLHFFVSKLNDDKEEDYEIVDEEVENYASYIGVWQIYGNDDEPNYELSINVLDGSTVTFDYTAKDVERFESQTATIENDTARFDIKLNDYELKGKMVFRNNKVYFTITSSNIDEISTGTMTFSDKGKESLLD